MPAFGNPNGPIYPLGKLTVAAVGTPIPLNQNVPIADQAGTPTGGVFPYTTSGTPSPLKANEIKVMTPSTNTGNIFLIFKAAGSAAGNSGTGVILVVQPGQERSVQSQLANAPYTVDQMALDTDAAGSVAWVTLII